MVEVRRQLRVRPCDPHGRRVLTAPFGYTDTVTFRWDSTHPLGVLLTAPGMRAEWPCTRHMLAGGLVAPTGIGRVRIGPAAGRVVLTLDGHDPIATARSGIVRFLAATERHMPTGTETVDVNGLLVELGLAAVPVASHAHDEAAGGGVPS